MFDYIRFPVFRFSYYVFYNYVLHLRIRNKRENKKKNYREDAIGILGKRRAERQGPENMEMNKNKSRSFYTVTSLCSSLFCSVPLFYCNLKPPPPLPAAEIRT